MKDTTMALVHEQREQANARLQDNKNDVAQSRTQMQELVQIIRELSVEVYVLTIDKMGENTRDRGRGRGTPPPRRTQETSILPPPPSRITSTLPLGQGMLQPLFSEPRSSSAVTPTSSWLPTGDPTFLNRNLYKIHVQGEERLEIPYPGPRDTIEDIRRRE